MAWDSFLDASSGWLDRYLLFWTVSVGKRWLILKGIGCLTKLTALIAEISGFVLGEMVDIKLEARSAIVARRCSQFAENESPRLSGVRGWSPSERSPSHPHPQQSTTSSSTATQDTNPSATATASTPILPPLLPALLASSRRQTATPASSKQLRWRRRQQQQQQQKDMTE